MKSSNIMTIKEQINILQEKRNKFLALQNESYNDETNEYEKDFNTEIDNLCDDIYKLLLSHHENLEIDFIIEQLTHLGGCPSILYDDDGCFAIEENGMQSISVDDKKATNMFFVVGPNKWHDTIRKAMRHYMNELKKEIINDTTN